MNIQIPFSKYHGNGNDFIIVLENQFPQTENMAKMVQLLCSRRLGIGADGLFIISSTDIYDFALDYYNADGSWETFCANGSRCAAKFMYDSNLVNRNMTFKTGADKHQAIINKNGTVKMSMKTPKYQTSLISPEGIDGFFIDSGARHFVCKTQRFDDKYIYNTGKMIRFSSFFQPQGVNVNFYRITDDIIEIKTYEKGVEQIMLSCASGSTAVIYHLSQSANLASPVSSRSAGGILDFTFDKNWKNSWVEGAATSVFTGLYNVQEGV